MEKVKFYIFSQSFSQKLFFSQSFSQSFSKTFCQFLNSHFNFVQGPTKYVGDLIYMYIRYNFKDNKWKNTQDLVVIPLRRMCM